LLEAQLIHIQADLEEAQSALAQCQSPRTSDVSLVLVYIGGVYWRHYFGPSGPMYPLDRYTVKITDFSCPQPGCHHSPPDQELIKLFPTRGSFVTSWLGKSVIFFFTVISCVSFTNFFYYQEQMPSLLYHLCISCQLQNV
jgi:hypothetical protein